MTTVYEGPSHLSVSQVKSLHTCAWRWFLEKAAHVPQRPAWALVGGKAFHTLSELIDQQLAEGTVPDLDWATRWWGFTFSAAVVEEAEKSGVEVSEFRASGRVSKLWPNKEDRSFWDAMAPVWAMNYVNWRINNPQWEIATINDQPAIELAVTGPIGASMDIVGYIDRVFYNPELGVYMVFDLKTGVRVPDDAMQLGVYSVMIEILFGVKVRYGTYWMARNGGTTPPVDLPAEWPLARIEHSLVSAEKTIRAGALEPSPSPLCASCSVRDYCFSATGNDGTKPVPWEVSVSLPLASPPDDVLPCGSDNNVTTEGEVA